MAKVIFNCAVRAAYISIGLLLGVFYMADANAQTFRGDELTCRSLASTAFDVAAMRDAGVPWDTFGPWIKNALEQAKENPESYVKDQEDIDFIYGWFKRIYDAPTMSPETAEALINRDCMKKPMRV